MRKQSTKQQFHILLPFPFLYSAPSLLPSVSLSILNIPFYTDSTSPSVSSPRGPFFIFGFLVSLSSSAVSPASSAAGVWHRLAGCQPHRGVLRIAGAFCSPPWHLGAAGEPYGNLAFSFCFICVDLVIMNRFQFLIFRDCFLDV